jgi:carbonic anhydrase/acetyltransferase-like protein (isoleucine patch superfamily)
MLKPHHGKAPQVGPRAFVAETAVVIGDVALEADSGVWFGAVLRADGQPIRVGARTNIQDLCVLHVTEDGPGVTIGADVTVGHRAIVHDCTVEDRCLIGMGAVVMNGAVIGAESIVGAGAVVPPRMQVPPRSLVLGVPARVVRSLTEQDVASNLSSAREYVALKDSYLG